MFKARFERMIVSARQSLDSAMQETLWAEGAAKMWVFSSGYVCSVQGFGACSDERVDADVSEVTDRGTFGIAVVNALRAEDGRALWHAQSGPARQLGQYERLTTPANRFRLHDLEGAVVLQVAVLVDA